MDTEQVWAVKLDGKLLQVRDLPIAVLDRVAKDTDVSWAYIVALPFADLKGAERLLAAAAEHLQVPAPDPSTLTARTIMDYFEQVDDDLPEMLVNGVPQ